MMPPARDRRIVTVTVAAIAAALWLVPASRASAQRAEGSFERTLKVGGPVSLSIRSGSGSIHVHPGEPGTVRISARLRASNSWLPGDARARIREIEKNPPIEQAGNVIRIGWFSDEGWPRNVSISYEVTVPAETSLNARTGSGGVEVGDLGGPVDANSGSGGIRIGRVGGAVAASTGSGGIEVAGAASLNARSGSGSIVARAVAGPSTAKSGSGGVRVVQAGRGDVDVSSSSGEVVVSGVDGAARISASSGGISVEGRPTGAWDVHASSGGVTLRIAPGAGFDLDASVSSGGIDSAHPVTVAGRIDRRHLQGKVNGGGPLVSVRSSSGGIRIE